MKNRLDEEIQYEECVEKRVERTEQIKQFPRTNDDFDMLFAEISRWKRSELKRIAANFEGPARISEVNILLDKEIQLLNGVERQRRLVSLAMEDFRKDQLLKEMGKPIEWIGYKDCKIHLDLLRTQRVRFLSEVYKDLRQTVDKENGWSCLYASWSCSWMSHAFQIFPRWYFNKNQLNNNFNNLHL